MLIPSFIKTKILLLLIVFGSLIIPFKSSSQAVNEQDSLALVDLYNSTNGPGWINNTNWLTAAPVKSWFGIVIYDPIDRVNSLRLSNNKLVGNIPSSLGNLTSLENLSLDGNQLRDSIPSSLGYLYKLNSLNLSYNQLSGIIPTFNSKGAINIAYNHFTFEGIEEFVSKFSYADYSPQADLPLHRNGNILSVSAGGTLANNTYKLYKDDLLLLTKKGDSNFNISVEGNYYFTVTNSIATRLTLNSINTTNTQDSLALVDLYNSTNGLGWTNNTNWLSVNHVGTWYGITVRKGRITDMQLFLNNLTGNLPSSLGNLLYLTRLRLESNKINGVIPFELSGLFSLINLYLNNNQLTGSIPSSFTNLSNLTGLYLNNNKLSGSIPSNLGNLSKLRILNLTNNQISGSIPSALINTTYLTELYLENNKLSGFIPSITQNQSNLIFLQANNNQLSGSIPPSLGNISKLRTLNLSDNQLSGGIPDSLSNLLNLSTLNLGNNLLTGKIPDSISKINRSITLRLKNNQLSGNLPSSFKTRRVYLEIQSNRFTFAGMEYLPAKVEASPKYSPQASIPLIKNESLLSVFAGGKLADETFRLYKNGSLNATQTGDSIFTISNNGKYYITVTNTIAPELTLTSDTITLGITLADTTTTVTQTITGNSATDVNNGNYKLITITTIEDPDALAGNVTTIVVIDSAVLSFNNQPYVQRHYDITPSVNADEAEASVTLYFTQQDFDNFNTYVTTHNLNIPLLPTGKTDNGNARIIQFHGTFTGSSHPENYSGSNSVIIPNVVWDNVNDWWMVTFSVSGFSGFYLSTANLILPLSLLQFTGRLHENAVNLQWVTSNEINTEEFVIELSNNKTTFTGIGKVAAQSATERHNYSFTDTKPLKGNNLYRLKMIDKDGHFTYSNIVPINIDNPITKLSVRPNPARSTTSLMFKSIVPGKYVIEIRDLSGKVIKRLNGLSLAGTNKVNINMQPYAHGTYMVTLIDDKSNRSSIKLSKQ